MKSTKIAARRVIQAGATFAAFGALTVAAALPAAADPVSGWAYASSNGGAGFIETQDGSVSDAFSVDYGWVSWSGNSTASVTGSGVLATVEVPSVRVQITVADAENGLPTEDEDEEETEDGAEASEEPTDTDDDQAPGDGEGDTGGDDTSGGGDDGSSEGGQDGGGESGGDTDEPAPTAPPADGDDTTPSPSPEPSPSAEDADADAAEADTTVVVLDETNSEPVSESDEILVEATISGISVSTFKSWDGSVRHSVDPGSVSGVTVPEDVDFTITPDIYEWEQPTEVDGYTWEDAYSVLDYDFKVDGELVQFVTIAETGVGTLTVDGGGNPGGGDGDGEEKPRPEKPVEKPEADDKKPVAQPAEALATTGSPIGGLIAAGAAIAAGGGAAAYLARRKKNAVVEAPAEENDN
ncbi:cell wall protein [Nocardiopsis flavescens]|uniref:cell wall protein n=1 Tax=Nocardiopsis flavescens TaxID=758803 RepID=UPI003647E67F